MTHGIKKCEELQDIVALLLCQMFQPLDKQITINKQYF